ncbi:MAG: 1-phosphofructokinase [Lachnoclostridium sp.]|nr:1-phosphofructokinase [Lachnoclostridium sp.]
MIYTVTFNPSLDYIISVDNFETGRTNRTSSELILPGGKGLNVSTVLWNLGVKSIALGFTAGFTGAEIEKRCKEIGFLCDFITLNSGMSRINIKLKDSSSTEINGCGPDIDGHALKKLFHKLSHLSKYDTLVLAGSIPKSISNTIYRDILAITNRKNITSVIDATGELLTNTLPLHPFLIKPNLQELEDIFGVHLYAKEDIVTCAQKLQSMGARNVLVSLGKEGAVLVSETGDCISLRAPNGTLINAVGAGDSMVAGFLTGWSEQRDYLYALKMAVASGSASAFSETLASKNAVQHLYNQL